jgi:hypothetical protein
LDNSFGLKLIRELIQLVEIDSWRKSEGVGDRPRDRPAARPRRLAEASTYRSVHHFLEGNAQLARALSEHSREIVIYRQRRTHGRQLKMPNKLMSRHQRYPQGFSRQGNIAWRCRRARCDLKGKGRSRFKFASIDSCPGILDDLGPFAQLGSYRFDERFSVDFEWVDVSAAEGFRLVTRTWRPRKARAGSTVSCSSAKAWNHAATGCTGAVSALTPDRLPRPAGTHLPSYRPRLLFHVR